MDAPLEISSVVRCQTVADVRDVVSLLLSWGARLPAGTPVRWRLPADGPLLAAEAEQVLGLVAAVSAAGTAGPGAGADLELAGTLRPEATAIALRWPRAALTVDGPVAATLAALPLLPAAMAQGLHLLDVEPGSATDPLWLHNVAQIVEAAAESEVPPLFGITVPPPFTGAGNAVRAVRTLLAERGLDGALVAMRVRGPLYVSDSAAVLALAGRYDLTVDLSLSHDDGHGGLRPYVDTGAYRPQQFDLRSPRLGSSGPLIELPRHDARRLLRSIADGRHSVRYVSDGLFDQAREAAVRRLRPVLDRAAQASYSARVNVDLSLIVDWTQYFVHNWAPPPTHRLAVLEVDALDLLEPDSTVRRACTSALLSDLDRRLQPAAAVFALAQEQADVQARGGAEQALQDQVAGHGYLADGGRPEMSGDSRSLLPLLPERTGRTLEIGCGYGVMARHVAERAALYVGVDLLLEQAQALREVGAAGIPADMHLLPFADEAFDSVIADNVLEHSYDPLALLTELHRVTRPQGRLYAVIPPDLASRDHSLRLHLWKTDRAGLQAALEQSGFALEQCHEVAYARVGAPGSFPSSHELTLLVVAVRRELPETNLLADDEPDDADRHAEPTEEDGGEGRLLDAGAPAEDADGLGAFGEDATAADRHPGDG